MRRWQARYGYVAPLFLSHTKYIVSRYKSRPLRDDVRTGKAHIAASVANIWLKYKPFRSLLDSRAYRTVAGCPFRAWIDWAAGRML